MRFPRNFSLLLNRMEARQCVVFTEDSGPVALVGGGPAARATRCGREAPTARAAGSPWPRDLKRAAPGRADSRVPRLGGGRAPCLARPVPEWCASKTAEQCASEAAARCALEGQWLCAQRR
jgi:hypothetical protein